MLNTNTFGKKLNELGFDLYAGVPCSFLKSLINYAINDVDYISATNEGDAIATCAGAYMAGKKPVILMQNSGLGNAVSPLTSLTHIFKIPLLMMVSLRGEEGLQDEPQHELMGKITSELLEDMAIQHDILSTDHDTALLQLEKANAIIEKGHVFCFIVKKNSFEKVSLHHEQNVASPKPSHHANRPVSTIGSRTDALQSILRNNDDVAIVSTTGKTGRECFELGDSKNQFYQVGSMGCISALGFGMAYAKPSLPVIVIDGDGAALMRLGSWATTGYYGPKNICHILLDNGVHDSTGGQQTAAQAVDFANCAIAMNYPNVISVSSLSELQDSIQDWKKHPRLTFIYAKIDPGSPKKLGRPTISPPEVKVRFMDFIKEQS